jgi:hypothetical protein
MKRNQSHGRKTEMKIILFCLGFLAMSIQQAFGIDPGMAQGSLRLKGETIPLTRAYAHLHDNVEGILDHTRELRIVLADREIPQSALAGIYMPVEQMALEGRVKGILIEFDPDKPDVVDLTVLETHDPGEDLSTGTVDAGGKNAFKRLVIKNRRVVGEMEQDDLQGTDASGDSEMGFSVRFNARLFTEPPVTSDLKGKDAQKSPLVSAFREKASAMADGDLRAMRSLSTERFNRGISPLIAEDVRAAKSLAEEAAARMEQALGAIQRVVVRGDHGVVIFGDEGWVSLVRDGKVWKSDH